MRTVFCIALLLALGCASSGSGPSDTGAVRLAAAIAAANRANQPLVVEFGAAWCKPCHVFADHVLTDPRVQAALHDIVFVQYDIDTPAGAEAMRACNVTGVPAIVATDREGVVWLSKTGSAPTTDEFLAFLQQCRDHAPAKRATSNANRAGIAAR